MLSLMTMGLIMIMPAITTLVISFLVGAFERKQPITNHDSAISLNA